METAWGAPGMGDSGAGHRCCRRWGKWDGRQCPSRGFGAAGDSRTGHGVPQGTAYEVLQGTGDSWTVTNVLPGDEEQQERA